MVIFDVLLNAYSSYLVTDFSHGAQRLEKRQTSSSSLSSMSANEGPFLKCFPCLLNKHLLLKNDKNSVKECYILTSTCLLDTVCLVCCYSLNQTLFVLRKRAVSAMRRAKVDSAITCAAAQVD